MDSEQRFLSAGPAVASSRDGAAALDELYWRVVERFTRGAVHVARLHDGGVELRLLRSGPRLLTLGPPELGAADRVVTSRRPIRGGLLTRRPGGWFALSQTEMDQVEVVSTVTGFFPSLARGPGWAGQLYRHVQSRVHVAVSRRFFHSLTEEPGE